jgi:acyl transferase domain-containing protein/acyl carrier protein
MGNSEKTHDYEGSEIAIIGMSCRFPGSPDLESFWRNLREAKELISFLKNGELEPSGISPAALDDPNYVKAASLLEDVENFDAAFFGITPREAEIMDPQQRLALECAWEALEHAGYNPEAYPGSIGVYLGARTNTYLYNLYSNPGLIDSLGAFEIGLGNDLAFLSSRISYKLNLKGPSYSIHTACSTSLVAVHLACQSLLIDECQMAIAGGVAINVPQRTGYLYQHGGIVSPDGHCRAFDSKAQGTIFGSGIGMVVLKRLEDALSDGDCIHAIIRGSATNNDGSTKASFTAPGVYGQAEVISEALASGGIDPKTITYVEAHGTGTPLGDPIEVRALTRAFRESTDKKGYCALGSVKTNLGHLDAAAGIASLIKTVLALRHKEIPASLHFEHPNSNIDLKETPFYINTGLSKWEPGEMPRRAGVSSFGIGGTNAHVILEESPELEASVDSRPLRLLVLSGRTGDALEKATSNLAQYLKEHPDTDLTDAAYTLQVGRKSFPHRRVVICQDPQDAVSALERLDPQRVFTDCHEVADRRVVMMFPGQGAQYVNMGLEIYETEQVFRRHIEHCSEILRRQAGLDLRAALYPPAGKEEEARILLNTTKMTQPALFVIEYALAKLWMHWGVKVEAMIGHSLGEYVAACLAGVISLDDALSIVNVRGELMQGLGRGGMLAVGLDEIETKRMLKGGLSLAAVNGPKQCIVSGREEVIEALEKELNETGVMNKRLEITRAFHSEMIEDVMEGFGKEMRGVRLSEPKIKYVSNLTGTWIRKEEATDWRYWVRHLRETVRFSEGVEEIVKEQGTLLLEVGPGQILSRLAGGRRSNGGEARALASLHRSPGDRSEERALLTTLGKLWLAGVTIDWRVFYGDERRHRLPLPTYPFERQRYWIGPREQVREAIKQRPNLGKQANLSDWFYIPSWKRTITQRHVIERLRLSRRRWLIFLDEHGLGSAILQKLQEKEQEVIIVRAAQEFGGTELGLTINPARREDYTSLLRGLRETDRTPTDILHLWSLDANDHAGSNIEVFKEAQQVGFYSLLFLAQALDEQAIQDLIQLWVLTNKLYEVDSSDQVRPEKATISAACHVIPQEYPNINCRCLDVVLPLPSVETRHDLAAQLITEFAFCSSDVAIAYRGNRRFVQSYEPVRFEEDSHTVRSLRENGVYLITGGMGGIGLLISEYLAKHHRAKLALVGRTALPDRRDWSEWIATHDESDAITKKLSKLKYLEELGAEVLVLSADSANEDQMKQVIEQVLARFGKLHGVIHAAGITSGTSVFNLISAIGPLECEAQFKPKVYGTYALEKVLRGIPLDFCLLFSSNAAVLGGLGFIAYSGANAFMDAFALSLFKTDQAVWISANWDHWPEETKQYTGYQTSMDQYTMTREESLEAFRRIACLFNEGQVVVSTGDLPVRYKLWVKRELPTGTAQSSDDAGPAIVHPRPGDRLTYVAPRNETEQMIVDVWQQVLGLDQVGVNDNFFDLGGHSLLANRLVSRLSDLFNIELPLGKFFEAPIVADLATAIVNIQAEQGDEGKLEILRVLSELSEDDVDREIGKRTGANQACK